MPFEITGQVRERETDNPLPGLIIRVHDQDAWFDDGLGVAVTDRQGCFSLTYSEREFHEVFEKRPMIYLAVYAPPFKHLLNTRHQVRWGDSARANFAIVVSGKKVGSQVAEQENQVHGSVSLSSRQLRIDTVDGWHIPRLPGFGNGSLRGSPSILEQLQYVLLPARAKVGRVEIVQGPVVRKGRNIKPYPVQPPRVSGPHQDLGEDDSLSDLQERLSRFVGPDPRYYQANRLYPEQLVELGRAEEWQGVQKIRVRVRPLQYDPISRQYLFYPQLRYIVHYELAEIEAGPLAPEASTTRRFINWQLVDTLDRRVVHANRRTAHIVAGVLGDQPIGAGSVPAIPHNSLVPYLIITDDYEWSETNAPEGDPDHPVLLGPPTDHGEKCGPLVKEFKRLAKWKTQRGMRTKVVTVREIVENKDDRYGHLNFRRQVRARDLQELIRNFIWWAHQNWGVQYVLLGGDTNIIPMRKLTGYITCEDASCGWDNMRTATDPPEEERCKYYPNPGQHPITKIHYYGRTCIWWPVPLLTRRGGKKIEYHAQVRSDHYPRWYFVTEEEFDTLSCGFTPTEPTHYDGTTKEHYYVIVEDDGTHPQDIDDDYYWATVGKTVPTDRYYACARSPLGIAPDARDFDANGNGFFGQFRWDEDANDEVPIDGFCIDPDVYIGRAPARNEHEANAFVNKVLAYERLKTMGTGPIMNTTYLKNVVHVANYSSRTSYHKSDTYDPDHHRARLVRGDITILDGAGQLNYRLILGSNSADLEIPYCPSGSDDLHWKFMDSSYTQPSAQETNYIQVEPVTVPDGSEFFWDPVGLTDRFHAHAETLRREMGEWYPDFDNVKRVYRDCFDPEPGEPELIRLTAENLKNTLHEGCHFLTVMAHGNKNGIEGMHAEDFEDTDPGQVGTYIVVAQSCSTAYPDAYDERVHSLGEQIVVQLASGAVAYVGSAQMDSGEEKSRWFWDNLRETRRLGPTSAACEFYDGIDQFWHKYNRTLYGDPEMPVWIKMPRTYWISWPADAAPGDEIVVRVKLDPMSVGLPGGPSPTNRAQNNPGVAALSLKGHQVTFVAGWQIDGPDEDWQAGPELFASKTTDSQGEVRFKIPETLQANSIEITVCACRYRDVKDKYDYKPETHTLTIIR